MKQSSLLLALLGILLVSLVLTGFQCGSPSLTSAKLYIKNLDWEGAEKSLTAEVVKNPANAEAWYLLGDTRRQLGNYAGMVEAFNNSVKVSPEFAKTIQDKKFSVWGTSINNGNNFYTHSISAPQDSIAELRKIAIENYKAAITVLPDSALPYKNLATVYHAQGNSDEEIANYKKALDLKKDPEISTNLINAYIRKAENAKNAGNADEATANFNNAINALTEARTADPNNQELLVEVINIYIEIGRSKEALPLIREAITKDPKNKVFQYDLGLLLMQTGEFEEAIQHFEAAVAADENYEDGLWNCAVAYMKFGDKIKKESDANADSKAYVEKFKSAAKLVEKLVTIKKDEPKYWTGLGTAYANAGMTKQAQKAFEQADALGKK